MVGWFESRRSALRPDSRSVATSVLPPPEARASCSGRIGRSMKQYGMVLFHSIPSYRGLVDHSAKTRLSFTACTLSTTSHALVWRAFALSRMITKTRKDSFPEDEPRRIPQITNQPLPKISICSTCHIAFLDTSSFFKLIEHLSATLSLPSRTVSLSFQHGWCSHSSRHTFFYSLDDQHPIGHKEFD